MGWEVKGTGLSNAEMTLVGSTIGNGLGRGESRSSSISFPRGTQANAGKMQQQCLSPLLSGPLRTQTLFHATESSGPAEHQMENILIFIFPWAKGEFPSRESGTTRRGEKQTGREEKRVAEKCSVLSTALCAWNSCNREVKGRAVTGFGE